MKIAEFFAALGFDVDDTGLIAFEKGLKNLRNEFALVTAAAIAALYGIDKFVAGSIAGAAALRDFNQQTGLSIEKLQKWQVVGQLTDMQLTADAVTSSIGALQKKLVDIQYYGEGYGPFAQLGLDTRSRNAFDILDQVREKIKGMPRDLATNMIQQLGLSPNFINILTLSKEKFDALFFSLSRSQATVTQLNKLGAAVTLAKIQFSLWKDNFVADLAPTLIKGIDLLGRFGTAAGHAWEVFSQGVTATPHIKDAFLALIPVIGLVVAAMFPLTATILAIILLFDDLYGYFHGADSVTGDLVSGFKKMKDELSKPLMDAYNTIKNWVDNNIINPLDDIIKRTTWLKAAADSINKVYDRITAKDALDPKGQGADIISQWPLSPLKWLAGNRDTDTDKFIQRSNGAPQGFIGGTAFPTQPTPVQNGSPSQPGNGDRADGPAFGPEPNPYISDEAAAASDAQSSKYLPHGGVTFNNTFHVQGGSDADDQAHTIAGKLQEQLKYGVLDFNNGPVR